MKCNKSLLLVLCIVAYNSTHGMQKAKQIVRCIPKRSVVGLCIGVATVKAYKLMVNDTKPKQPWTDKDGLRTGCMWQS